MTAFPLPLSPNVVFRPKQNWIGGDEAGTFVLFRRENFMAQNYKTDGTAQPFCPMLSRKILSTN